MNDVAWQDAGPAAVSTDAPEMREVAGRMIMVVRHGDALHATDATCPHKFTLLTEGRFADGCVTCPQHDATFDLQTGSAGDESAWAGMLPVHEVRVDADRLLVRLADQSFL